MMLPDEKNNPVDSEDAKLPAANTGNASNPSPDESMETIGNHQLLSKKAEKYLREAGNIEDVPDAQEQQQADEIIQKENKEQ